MRSILLSQWSDTGAARDLGVAPNTVVRAYRELELGGWVVARPRRGVAVATPSRQLVGEDRRRGLAEAVAGLLETAHRIGVQPAELHAELERQELELGVLHDPRENLDRFHAHQTCLGPER